MLDIIGLGTDAAHVHLGLALFLLGWWRLRHRRHGTWLALGLVGLMQAVNEGLDALDWLGWTGTVRWREALGDTVHTLLWPAIVAAILARR